MSLPTTREAAARVPWCAAAEALERGLRALVETLLPSACAACGDTLGRIVGPTCSDCRTRLEREFVATRCVACSAPLAARASDEQQVSPAEESCCGSCGRTRGGRRRGVALHAPRTHAGVARRLIHAFKYRGRRDVAELLARETSRASDVLAALHDVDVIVPVPSDPVRRHQRGFDATAILARELVRASMHGQSEGGRRGLMRPPRVLQALRVRRSSPQVSRDAVARRAAPAGSMSARWPAALFIRGRRVALVDDVVTTGATLREAERVLRRLGASHVVSIACTRAPGEISRTRARR